MILTRPGPVENSTVYMAEDINAAGYVPSQHLVTSVRVVRGVGHDEVHVWNRGAKSGVLVVGSAEGDAVARRLLGEKLTANLPTPPTPVTYNKGQQVWAKRDITFEDSEEVAIKAGSSMIYTEHDGNYHIVICGGDDWALYDEDITPEEPTT